MYILYKLGLKHSVSSKHVVLSFFWYGICFSNKPYLQTCLLWMQIIPVQSNCYFHPPTPKKILEVRWLSFWNIRPLASWGLRCEILKYHKAIRVGRKVPEKKKNSEPNLMAIFVDIFWEGKSSKTKFPEKKFLNPWRVVKWMFLLWVNFCWFLVPTWRIIPVSTWLIRMVIGFVP